MENSFGDFLKSKRQEKNLTQKELANKLFVTESAVSKWEKDVAHPDITLLPKLSEILGVTEHELITASVDKKTREEKSQAKKWRAFSVSWSLFFYIAYAVALIPCFICNLAIDKTLSWFWIVASALLLAFSFTNSLVSHAFSKQIPTNIINSNFFFMSFSVPISTKLYLEIIPPSPFLRHPVMSLLNTISKKSGTMIFS